MGALLICGIHPPPQGTEIPSEGINLDSMPIPPGDPSFQRARRILADWWDWCEDRGKLVDEVHPIAFLNWCKEEDIQTDWLRLFSDVAGYPQDPHSFDLTPPTIATQLISTALSMGSPLGKVALDTPANPIDVKDRSALAAPPVSSPQSNSAFPGAAFRERALPDSTSDILTEGMPTPLVAAIFEGLHPAGQPRWSTEKWRRTLQDSKWIQSARTRQGKRGHGGQAASMWDPVQVAACAILKKGLPFEGFRQRFHTQSALLPWLAKWQEYEHMLIVDQSKPGRKTPKIGPR